MRMSHFEYTIAIHITKQMLHRVDDTSFAPRNRAIPTRQAASSTSHKMFSCPRVIRSEIEGPCPPASMGNESSSSIINATPMEHTNQSRIIHVIFFIMPFSHDIPPHYRRLSRIDGRGYHAFYRPVTLIGRLVNCSNSDRSSVELDAMRAVPEGEARSSPARRADARIHSWRAAENRRYFQDRLLVFAPD